MKLWWRKFGRFVCAILTQAFTAPWSILVLNGFFKLSLKLCQPDAPYKIVAFMRVFQMNDLICLLPRKIDQKHPSPQDGSNANFFAWWLVHLQTLEISIPHRPSLILNLLHELAWTACVFVTLMLTQALISAVQHLDNLFDASCIVLTSVAVRHCCQIPCSLIAFHVCYSFRFLWGENGPNSLQRFFGITNMPSIWVVFPWAQLCEKLPWLVNFSHKPRSACATSIHLQRLLLQYAVFFIILGYSYPWRLAFSLMPANYDVK